MNDPVGNLKMIYGQLWYMGDNKIAVYSTDLEKLRTIKLSDIGCIMDLAEMKGDMVTVASNTGIFLIDKQGIESYIEFV